MYFTWTLMDTQFFQDGSAGMIDYETAIELLCLVQC